MSKSLLASKTFWFNVLMVFLEFSALPDFQHVLPASWLPYLLALQGLGNIVLRYITTQPISSVSSASITMPRCRKGGCGRFFTSLREYNRTPQDAQTAYQATRA